MDVVLEREDEEDRGNRGKPVKQLEGVLQTDGCIPQSLHQIMSVNHGTGNVLRSMSNCMRITDTNNRLMMTFQRRCMRHVSIDLKDRNTTHSAGLHSSNKDEHKLILVHP